MICSLCQVLFLSQLCTLHNEDEMIEKSGQAGDLTTAEVRESLALLPALEDFKIPRAVLEVAGELVDASDVIGVESGALELLCRLIAASALKAAQNRQP